MGFKKRLETYLKNSYGMPRENIEERYERIGEAAKLFRRDAGDIPDTDKVDDITWNDLGMDDIFIEADHTDSFAGEQYLYSVMRRLDANESELAERDRRAGFFDKNEEKRNKVRKALYKLGQSPSGFFLIDNIDDIGSRHLKHRAVFIILPLVLIACILAAVITRIPIFALIAVTLVAVNMIVHTLVKGSIDVSMQTIFNAVAVINTAKTLTEIVPDMSGDTGAELKKLSGVMKRSAYIVAEKMAEVTNNTVMNIVFFVLNIFMLDLIFFDLIIDELIDKTKNFMNVFRFTGSIDCAVSLASYRRYAEDICIPEFSADNRMSIKGVYHPLIVNAVRNDMDYSRNTIITGSNASGKSTFIKSAAIALILGQTLHICHGESAVIPRCGVMTSMAVRDDVLSGESYYIREIRYLKRMVELCGSGRTMFLAVDEILRGTNTRERIAASKAVMEYFSDQNCMVIVATHDTELAEYFRDKCDNFHFCETVSEGDVVFDYKLHEGISATSNAIRLLGAMGFPEDIVSAAQSYASV